MFDPSLFFEYHRILIKYLLFSLYQPLKSTNFYKNVDLFVKTIFENINSLCHHLNNNYPKHPDQQIVVLNLFFCPF